MFFVLINIGLVATPYLGLLGFYTRDDRAGAALIFAAGLCLWGIYRGWMKRSPKWLTIFVLYLFFSAWQAPRPLLLAYGIDISNFWVWKSLLFALSFFGMYVAVRNAEITTKQRHVIYNVMSWCGFVMALICLGHSVYIHQWTIPNACAKGVTQGQIGGFLGQPTVVAPYIAMLVPIALLARKRAMAAIMAATVLVIYSQMAIGGLAVGLGTLWGFKSRKRGAFLGVLGAILAVFLVAGYVKSPQVKSFVGDSGRFKQWSTIVQDLNTPMVGPKAYPYTGRGPGSFRYTYHVWHKNNYDKAHNEYLELLYDTGIAGLVLFVVALVEFARGIRFDREKRHLFAGFACISAIAFGAFVWHLGTYMFYTVLLAGLIRNEGR